MFANILSLLKHGSLIFVLLLVVGCDQQSSVGQIDAQQQAEQLAIRQKTLWRGIYSAHFQLNPHFATTVADVAPLRDLLVGLVRFNEKGDIIPAIATQWLSEDGKEWLFLLDETAHWSNGLPITAQDFMRSWQLLADPKSASPLAPYLEYMGIENARAIIKGEMLPEQLGVVALNEKSLRIRLTKPNPQFPKMLAHSALLPLYQGKVETGTNFVSNGDYQLEYQTQEKLQLKAVNSQPFFARVQYQLLRSNQSVDGLDIVENPINATKNTLALPKLCTYFYEFNFNDPLLRKKEIRQALLKMVSTIEFTDNQRLGLPNFAILPASMKREAIQERAWDPVAIEDLLSKAGITVEKPLTLTLTYDNSTFHSQIANRLIRNLSQSDLIKIVPHKVDWTQLLAQREKGEFQLIRSGWCADYRDPTQFLMLFYSTNPDNKMGYINTKIDQQLTQLAQSTQTEQEREQLIQHIASELAEDVAILPLFQYQRELIVDPTLRGIDLNNDSEVIYSKDLYRLLSAQ